MVKVALVAGGWRLAAGGCHLAALRLGVVLKIIANYVKRQLLGAGGARVRPIRPVLGERLPPRLPRFLWAH